MSPDRNDAPSPDLRIVRTESLHPHEEHDSQRALPLIERLQNESVMVNPPIVSSIGANEYVVLDGANRYYAFSRLEYPHILVQVATYESGYVELKNWRHIVCDWDLELFLERLRQLPEIEIIEGEHAEAIARILVRDQSIIALRAPINTVSQRNAALRKVVSIYQQNAVLHRTALDHPNEIWNLYPTAIAIMTFPPYLPEDIIAAAHSRAYLPPGISRHIIHGRALRVNYPLDELRNMNLSLGEKNHRLQSWVQKKLENRRVRYYAEATYQFDE